jgi:putative ABC transport system permease protein
MRLSGRYRSALIIGGQGIRARKLRTFLSMISLFLGVLAVVAVQAGAELANRAMLADVELTSGKDGTLQAYLPTGAEANEIAFDVIKDQPGVVATMRAQAMIGEPGLAPLNPGASPIDQPDMGMYGPPMECDASGMCTPIEEATPAPPGQTIEVTMMAITGDLRQFKPFPLDSGQWLDFGAKPSLSPGIVLNREAAKAFTRHQVPAEMAISGAEFNATPRILGVVHDAGYGPTIYVRADEIFNWMPLSGGGSAMYGPPTLDLMLHPADESVLDTLRTKFDASGIDSSQMYIQPVDITARLGEQITLMRLIFLGMAALVLLIGVAGILNVGLATVGERIEEFALRRAVGTPRLLLAGIVLAETLIIGLFTAAAAIGLGVAALNIGGQYIDIGLDKEAVTFPWEAGVAGVLAGLIAGILGGLIPAIRAARIPIATVMRA